MATKIEVAKRLLEELQLSDDQLAKVTEIFDREVNYGLNSDEKIRQKTVLPMIKTFLTETPEKAHGFYLGIDLGSSNFRIILADLSHDDPKFDTETEPLPKEYYGLPCRNLYDFMAVKLSAFLKKRGLEKAPIKLGYTFSFPTVQDSVKCAKLITWTQTFHCPDGVGEDAGKLLQDAINKRQDCDVEVVAVLNDTTATLIAGAFVDAKCAIGVIIGTGGNAAYYESMDRMPWFANQHYHTNPPKRMIVDIECGCFGDDAAIDFLKSKFDKELDRTSLHPGSYTFEKMFSGHFFGELVRLVLVELSESSAFLKPEVLPRPWQLTSTDISPVNADPDNGELPATRGVLEKLDLLQYCDDEDVKVLHMVIRALTKRAGDFVGAALATLVRHIGEPEITIAFDGSFYRCQPHLSQYIGQRISILCPNYKVKMFLVHDGSGRGGALAAASVKG